METIPVPPAPLTRPSTHFTVLDDLAGPFRFGAKSQTYAHQYSSIYFLRLHEMKQILLQRCHSAWDNVPGEWSVYPPEDQNIVLDTTSEGDATYVPRILDVKKGRLTFVIGTVYMDMPLKPSILEDITKDEWTLTAPPRETYVSTDDSIMLEDESGRVRLTGEIIEALKPVTGIIIGVLGLETSAGHFEVVDHCLPGLPPQVPLTVKPDVVDVDKAESSGQSQGEWVALVSGLEIGLESGTAADHSAPEVSLQLMVDYLVGEAGGVEDQSFSSQISRLVIVGDSVVPIVLEDDEGNKARRFNAYKTKFDPTPLRELTALLTEVSRALPVHLLPGSKDPAGTTLPQQPFPRPIFGKELMSKSKESFVCETNPTWVGVGECEILACSGQTLEDMFKYVEGPTRMEMAKNTLQWRHMAPTAPDTLWCYPYLNQDPFILTRCPHIYVVGNQPEFATDIVTG
ncbi:hypothetical protein FRB99_005504 [Tulasnella sp. 403]|nr:hypothetical protein FRB99_005504 [Tulasnella sp. 403]